MNRKALYAGIRKLFNGSLTADQVKGIDGILDAFQAYGDGKPDTLAYALATAYHETGRRMVPVREGFATSDGIARKAVNRLAAKRGPNSAVAKYAKPDPTNGLVYYGRGHVQLTWKDNYAKSSNDAGHNLVSDPDLMLDPVISARVLIKGLLDGRWNGQRKGLRFYLDKGDVIGARRTVNILDKANEIASYHNSFLAAIKAAQGATVTVNVSPDQPIKPYVPTSPPPINVSPDQPIKPYVPISPPPIPSAPQTPPPAVSGFSYALIASILKLLGTKK